MKINSININNVFRNENELSFHEYIFCEIVNIWSSNTVKSIHPGWCYSSKETIAEQMSLSRQAVITIMNRMIEKGFIEKDELGSFLKTTDFWKKSYFTDCKETLHTKKSDCKETLHDAVKLFDKDCKETLHNTKINSLNIDSINYADSEKSERLNDKKSKKEEKDKTYSECLDIWYRWYEKETGIKPIFNAAAGQSLKQIISYFKLNYSEFTPQKCFETMFKNWNKLEPFYRDFKDIKKINSSLNTILSQIKNGKSTESSTEQERIKSMAENAVREIHESTNGNGS